MKVVARALLVSIWIGWCGAEPVRPDTVDGFRAEVDGSRVLTLRFRLRGAEAVRLHLTNVALPAGSKLWVRGIEDSVAGPYEGSGPGLSGDFWTEAVEGSETVLELRSYGEVPADLPFVVSEIAAGDRVGSAPASVDRAFEAVEGDMLIEAGKGSTLRKSVAITDANGRWPGGILPYVIDEALPDQMRVRTAVDHWNSTLAGVVKMVPRTTETNYVQFVRSADPGSCLSHVGMAGNGMQSVRVGDTCSAGNLIHEIGHAFGLWHEQSREDRDRFVKLQWANIDPERRRNFEQNIDDGDDAGAYDYASIMHYGARAFSANGLPSIETIPPGIPIGQRNALSPGDIAAIKSLYPIPQEPVRMSVQNAPAEYTVTSNPSGVPVIVDSKLYVTPAVFRWTPGSVHTLSAPNPVAGESRHLFERWSDAGAQAHTITASAPVYTANFSVAYALRVESVGPGTVRTEPQGADGYYLADSRVVLEAAAPEGYCFTGWSGLLEGTSARVLLNMRGPYAAAAKFEPGSISVSETAFDVPVSGGNIDVGVSASSGCNWSASSDSEWATVTAGGVGTGTATITVEPNASAAERTAIVTAAGVQVTVRQAAIR